MITLGDKQLCENCFSEIKAEPCPYCGFERGRVSQDPIALATGSVLSGRYKIGGVVGKGGFGITYLAYDLKLDARTAVKEYYPLGLAVRTPGSTLVSVSSGEAETTFRSGAEKFYNEAKMVAKFNNNPNIVSVYDFFYENDTVYLVMGYLQGQTLKSYLKDHKITEGQAVYLLNHMSNALHAPHSMNILHRDVSPDNIMLCDDSTVRLLDFGAARQVMAEQSQSLSVILKQGYAPLEQYQKKGNQGPWTDIYALGATVYTALTGELLPDPISRLEDDSAFEANKKSMPERLGAILDKCLQLKAADRYQNIEELREDLINIGIQEEKFTGIKEEITDCLRGKTTGSIGQSDQNARYQAPNGSKQADPNATVFLGATPEQSIGQVDPNATMYLGAGGSGVGSSNETVAMSPQEAAAYAGMQNMAAGQPDSVQGTPLLQGAPIQNPEANQQPFGQLSMQGVPGQDPGEFIQQSQQVNAQHSSTKRVPAVLWIALGVLALLTVGVILKFTLLSPSDTEGNVDISAETEETESTDESAASNGSDDVEAEDESGTDENEAEEAGPASGKCGDDSSWSYEDGTLTISGTGKMESYNGLDSGEREAPWGSIRDSIKNVIIEDGISSIGAYAFAKCKNLTEVSIPSSVQKIGLYAFQDCESLKEVTVPSGVDYKSNFAFQGTDTRVSETE